MRVSYLWLKDLLDFSLSPEELAGILTMTGLEVENLESVGPDLDAVLVGKVLEVNPHPNASKLTLCKVDIGKGVLEVVCGAPNVKAGQKVPFIQAGETLPNGMVIEARSIRGVRSEGMICSEMELGLGEDHEGLMILDADAEVGQPLQDHFGPRDWGLDLEITINRPDCLSHLGVAREISAALKLDFTPPDYDVEENGPAIDKLTSIVVEEPDLCPRYSARIIQGVKIGPSSDWMKRRLEAVGLRSINNVVDVTNYVMLETGHPMHAFDLDMLEERRIVVRCGAAGETFITLDELERHLDDHMLLICDGRKGVALAGVMGGLNSEITDQTQDLLLESAYFDPVNTRRTAKLLNLTTDSSRRFERGADPNATVRALNMAAALIVKLAGGKTAKGVADEYPKPIPPWQVQLRPARVKSILGVEVDAVEMRDHLARLGCEVTDSDPLKVTVPTSRFDLEREIDLIEEVARLHGYDKVPVADRASVSLDVPETAADIFQDRLTQVLVKLGFYQVKTSPLISDEEAALSGYPEAVRLRNPGSEDMAFLCNGLFPGLLKVAAHNLHRDIPDFRLFEIDRVFSAGEMEWDALAGLMVGVYEPQRWDQVRQAVDFLDLKGVMESLLREISLDKFEFIPYNIGDESRFTADCLQIVFGDKIGGLLGQLHPDLTAKFDIEEPMFGFELDVASLREASEERVTYQPFPKYPALQRDLAFVVAEKATAGSIHQAILESGGKHLATCELFDMYRGQQIGEGNKSLAFRLSFQSAEHTLTDEEADESIEAVVRSVERKFGAKLRS